MIGTGSFPNAISVTAYDIASRFIGLTEVPGQQDNPAILAMLKLDSAWPEHDEVPWCSAFCNYPAWLLRLPRSKNLQARSWLTVGRVVTLEEARAGFDVVILNRAGGPMDPDARRADGTWPPGHVGFFAGYEAGPTIALLGGNQDNQVKVSHYPATNLLGIRRLYG